MDRSSMRSGRVPRLAASVCLGAAATCSAFADTFHLERAVIVDATGFETPLAASTLFLPVGWRTQGGVFWGQEFACTNGYNFDWTATAPDGRTSVAVLPQFRWESNSYGAAPSTPGCGTAPFTNVRQYLEAAAQNWKAGARVLDFRPREDLTRDYAHMNAVTPMPMGEARVWVEAGEVLFAFNEGGTDMRGSLAAIGIFSLNRTNSAGLGLPQMDAFTGYVLPSFGATAPNGQLSLPFFEALRRTLKENSQWQSRIANHNNAIGQVALRESQRRSQMIQESNAEIARIREEAWNASQQSADRRAREFGELLRGVETYDDANAPGGTVQLSAYYNNAWRLDDGSYVLSNDSGFEPFRDLGIAGRALEQTR